MAQLQVYNVSDSCDSEEYQVEKIKGKRVQGGVTEYLVKWVDYSSEHDEWLPQESLAFCKNMVEDYELSVYKPRTYNRRKPIVTVAGQGQGQEQKKTTGQQDIKVYKKRGRKKKLQITEVSDDSSTPNCQLSSKIDQMNLNSLDLITCTTNQKVQGNQIEQCEKDVQKKQISLSLMSNQKMMYKEGSFEENQVQSIEAAQFIAPVLFFKVYWKQPTDASVTIVPTLYSSLEIRKQNPYLLLDYYESKLRFI